MAQRHPLDNSVWKSLMTRHSAIAEGSGDARRFVPSISTLAGIAEQTQKAYDALGSLLSVGDEVNMSLQEPFQPKPGWTLVFGGPMLQMVHTGDRGAFHSAPERSMSLLELGAADAEDMFELTALTKPGPFTRRTHELGTYLGIRQDGRLVAMAGERLKVPGYTEVSAVCTHPGHVGKGYARLLMTEIMRRIFDRSDVPFLHVRESNVHAIGLYERLGFETRVRLQHAVLRKES